MADPKFADVDAYIASRPEAEQADLRAIRAAILKGAPEAEEVISYGIPAYRLDGWLYYFSAHTKHYSLSSPPPNTVWDAFGEQIKGYKRSLSALQFPKGDLPLELISEMAAAKAAENRAKAAAAPARGKKA